jgi:hypothetical protein
MFKSQRVPVTNELAENTVADFKSYHISYNSNPANYGCRTTALVMKNNVFFILNGDHKDAMLEASEENGLQGCFDYFLRNLDKANGMSEHHSVLKGKCQFNLHKYALEYLGAENIERLLDAGAALKNNS